jgi:metal-responsive CopG/Arc/MetJ family transcriptional regulator
MYIVACYGVCYILYMRRRELQDNRVMVSMTNSLVRRIEDFRYQFRIPSRAAAIKVLLEEALGKTDRNQDVKCELRKR